MDRKNKEALVFSQGIADGQSAHYNPTSSTPEPTHEETYIDPGMMSNLLSFSYDCFARVITYGLTPQVHQEI
jgi:hypothetical protein